MIHTGLGETGQEEITFDAEATMVSAQTGDITAFGELYSHLAPEIHSHLLHLSSGDEPLAEDFTQDTFIRAFNSLDSYHIQNKGSVKSWLYRIATNRYLDNYRRQQRVLIESAGNDLPEPSTFDRTEPLEDQVITRVDLEQYAKEIHAILPPDFARAICATSELDLSYGEAATVLGIKKATTATRLYRAKQQARTVPVPEGYELASVN